MIKTSGETEYLGYGWVRLWPPLLLAGSRHVPPWLVTMLERAGARLRNDPPRPFPLYRLLARCGIVADFAFYVTDDGESEIVTWEDWHGQETGFA